MLIVLSVLACNSGCPLKDERSLIEDEQAFHELSFDQQSSLIGSHPRLDRRISELTDEIKSTPSSSAYTGRGSAYLLKGDLELARSDYDSAIKLDPKNAAAYYNRGLLHAQLLDYELAIIDFTSAIDANSQAFRAYANRGSCYVALEKYGLGIADLRKAIELDPDNHLTMCMLGSAILENPDHVDADAKAALMLLTRACELTNYAKDDYVQTLRYYEKESGIPKN